MISPFIRAGFKGRPECGTLVSGVELFKLPIGPYIQSSFFSNKNTQHSHKGKRVAISVYCINSLFLSMWIIIRSRFIGLVLGGLYVYVSIPPIKK